MNKRSYQYVNRLRYQVSANDGVEGVLNQDCVISEEPLSIVLHWTCDKTGQRLEKNLMVTMRTPGDDALLVTGLLLSYSVISRVEQIQSIILDDYNQCDITLDESVILDWEKLTRHFISHSGCGICGANNVKALAQAFNVKIDETAQWLSLSSLLTLPMQLKQQQSLFSVTGGVHSAGIFTSHQCLSVKEDVGRHNAVDKVIGDVLIQGFVINQSVLMLSGRISFELMQKAVAAKIPVVAAIGAPSSLAITVAKQFNITLVGFISDKHCNVYHGDFRLIKEINHE